MSEKLLTIISAERSDDRDGNERDDGSSNIHLGGFIFLLLLGFEKISMRAELEVEV